MRIGIFGKSGSGKTTVAKYFESKGFFHIDLDVVGKEVVDTYPEIRTKIGIIFGEEYLTENGIDRKKLGERVFGSDDDMEKLNSIFFEYIKPEALKLVRSKKKVVLEGAILVDIGLNESMDIIIYVKTKETTALKRLMTRDGLDKEIFINRLDKQKRYDLQGLAADYIIETNDSHEELELCLDTIYSIIKNKV